MMQVQVCLLFSYSAKVLLQCSYGVVFGACGGCERCCIYLKKTKKQRVQSRTRTKLKAKGTACFVSVCHVAVTGLFFTRHVHTWCGAKSITFPHALKLDVRVGLFRSSGWGQGIWPTSYWHLRSPGPWRKPSIRACSPPAPSAVPSSVRHQRLLIALLPRVVYHQHIVFLFCCRFVLRSGAPIGSYRSVTLTLTLHVTRRWVSSPVMVCQLFPAPVLTSCLFLGCLFMWLIWTLQSVPLSYHWCRFYGELPACTLLTSCLGCWLWHRHVYLLEVVYLVNRERILQVLIGDVLKGNPISRGDVLMPCCILGKVAGISFRTSLLSAVFHETEISDTD